MSWRLEILPLNLEYIKFQTLLEILFKQTFVYMDVYSSYPKLWFCSLELMVAEMPIQENKRDIFDKKCFYFAKGFRLCQKKKPFFIIFT